MFFFHLQFFADSAWIEFYFNSIATPLFLLGQMAGVEKIAIANISAKHIPSHLIERLNLHFKTQLFWL